MAVQWYPGHMHKARKEMQATLPGIDLIIEVLDARIPASSQNPDITGMRGNMPCIKILCKSDLADPQMTQQWVEYLEQQKAVRVLPLCNSDPGRSRILLELCKKMLPHTTGPKTRQAIIVGIPNVGKSTLINSLAGRSVARTGNEPAITRGQQRINLGDGLLLLDTPGILWPRVENPHSAYRLAASGAIKDTAMDYVDVGFYLTNYLRSAYPDLLMQRFDLKSVGADESELLDMAAQRRGALGTGGRADLNRICKILINELRSGTLGRVTLESPNMLQREEIEVVELNRRREARKKRRKNRSRTSGNVAE